VDELYRQMFNPSLYWMAWGRIYANKGAMTPGATPETADGMDAAKINGIIGLMRQERYRFAPARRVLIPKKAGGQRPLGMPTWTDKLVGEVVRLLLEAYYEPQFSEQSDGFRPGRGCHTALREIANTWTGTTWFIEGDIKDCFGSLDHQVLLGIMAEKIKDNRFLELVRRMLRSGYLEDWKWRPTLSGAPQGGIASPVLSNIYLHKLDQFVTEVLMPEYNKGWRRSTNPAYDRASYRLRIARRRGDREAATAARAEMLSLPRCDPEDPGYRRLRYVRYADDHLLGFAGPRREAEQIKERLAVFLHDELKLELSDSKTLITHARTGAARFLGYDITVAHQGSYRCKGRRSLNGQVRLRVPGDVVKAKAAPYLVGGKPEALPALFGCDDYSIVAWYGAVYRGIVNYYKLACNIGRLHWLRWVMETSMLKTLAGKHHTTVSKAAAHYRAKVMTPGGLRTCFEARLDRGSREPLIAKFGEVQLVREAYAWVVDPDDGPRPYPRKELLRRVAARRCELCGITGLEVVVHQVKGLSVLDPAGPLWEGIMVRRRRKTLVVCHDCHDLIHQAEPFTSPLLESRMR
jgi:group II intron reverse transcriptase/maturase